MSLFPKNAGSAWHNMLGGAACRAYFSCSCEPPQLRRSLRCGIVSVLTTDPDAACPQGARFSFGNVIDGIVAVDQCSETFCRNNSAATYTDSL